MRTPERIEKDKVKKYLSTITKRQHWPVTGGWGTPALDCIACIHGFYVEIEVKAPGGARTARQDKLMRDTVESGGGVFSGTGDQIIKGISEWLAKR